MLFLHQNKASPQREAHALSEYGVPVIMATGDQALIREALAFLPGIETVQVKTSSDSKTTKCLLPSKAKKLIETAAERALSRVDEFKPLKITKPFKIDVSFPNKEQADMSEIIPRAKRIGENTVSYTAEKWDDGNKFVMTTLSLANEAQMRTFLGKPSKLKGYREISFEWAEARIDEWLS